MTCYDCKRWIEKAWFEKSLETKSITEHLKIFPSHEPALIDMHRKLARLRIGDYR